jgi:hypothetical protein
MALQYEEDFNCLYCENTDCKKSEHDICCKCLNREVQDACDDCIEKMPVTDHPVYFLKLKIAFVKSLEEKIKIDPYLKPNERVMVRHSLYKMNENYESELAQWRS